jgi:DNA (cytosine-5)-methyltransferase 1
MNPDGSSYNSLTNSMAFLTTEDLSQPEITDKTSHVTLTCADYFAGIGLVRLGLEKAGWHIVFSNDWASDKFDMYAAHFGDAKQHYVVKDIFSLDPDPIPSTLLATASFPCIDLSLAGNLSGIHGKHSSAFWGFTSILDKQAKKPRLILLENVAGWLTSNRGQDFRITIQELNRLGYGCDVFSVDASHFLPQSRPRIFVLGMQWTASSPDILTFSSRSLSLRTPAIETAVLSNLDLNWNFLDIPALPQKVEPDLNPIIEELPDDDARWWSDDEVERHLAMMTPINLSYLQTLKNLPHYTYCTMYRRVRQGQQRAELRKDGFAGCLRTAKGGSSRQMLVRSGYQSIRMRVMTPREYARLQGVPDDYPIPSQVNQALTGFGDAVCVPVITWIAINVLNPLVKSLPEKIPVLQ